MTDVIIELGERYRIIYDDKGFKAVVKEGIIVKKENNLIELDNEEILNMHQIIRAIKVKNYGQ